MADGMNVAQLVVTVGANTAMAEQGIMGIARMLGSGGILALGAVGAGLAIVGIGAAATKMAGDFQTQLTTLVTGAGEAQGNLGMISSGVLQMARDTGTSTGQLTSGLYMIESAGIHGAGALDVLKAAAEGAKVGGADLGTVADAVTTILKNYGDTGLTASGATNTLIATVANGKTHMQDLATALSSILPTAQAAGVGLNDVMAAMAAQTAAGVPAADAATHLRQLIIALVAPSSSAQKALEGVGLTTDEVATKMKQSLPGALQMIQEAVAKKFPVGSAQYVAALKNISGGMREMQGMLLLTSKSGMADFSGDVTKIAGQVKQGGSQIQGWTLVQGTFNQKMSQLGEIFQTVMIALGTKLLPVATQFAGLLADDLGPVVDMVTGKNKALSSGLAGELFTAAKNLANIFETEGVPILHTFATVLEKQVLPAIMPVVKTIVEQWLPPLERIMKDVLPVLNPLLQALGWLFQNVIGPGLNYAAQAVGAMLGGVADLTDGISRFLANPSIKSFNDFMHTMSGFNSNMLHTLSGGLINLPHFAGGGVMDTSGPALVGENGPEIVYLPGGATVAPMANGLAGLGTPTGLSGGYGAGPTPPITINQTITLDGHVVARQIVKALPDVVRNGTGTRHF